MRIDLRVALYQNHSKHKQKNTTTTYLQLRITRSNQSLHYRTQAVSTPYKISRARGFIRANRTAVKASESRHSSLSNNTQFVIKLGIVLAYICVCGIFCLHTCLFMLTVFHKQMHIVFLFDINRCDRAVDVLF